ncbi:hypothetical protein TNCV_5027191 [Trichonephila clavipes]|nr:hypothetical protein TNCV_5027191 [Trichonephila clavipes]
MQKLKETMNKIQDSEKLLNVYTELLKEEKLEENKEIKLILMKSIKIAKSKNALIGQLLFLPWPDSSIADMEPIKKYNTFAQLEQFLKQPLPTCFEQTHPKPTLSSCLLILNQSFPHALTEGSNFEYYAMKPKVEKPIKKVIKALPTSRK